MQKPNFKCATMLIDAAQNRPSTDRDEGEPRPIFGDLARVSKRRLDSRKAAALFAIALPKYPSLSARIGQQIRAEKQKYFSSTEQKLMLIRAVFSQMDPVSDEA